MSRTDKTNPHWVNAEWWEPDHNSCQHATWRRGWRDCDLPDNPVRLARFGRTMWHSKTQTCEWSPMWTGRWGSLHGMNGVPPWYVRMAYTAPERRNVRDQLAKARAEYRATSEVDVIPATTQHRHQARWVWY